MAIGDLFKVSRKTFVNPRAWLGYDEVKSNTATIFNSIKPLLSVPQPTIKENFAEAMKRQGLHEKDIKKLISSYQLYALIFALLAFCTFGYAFYLLFLYQSLTGWLLSLCVCALFISQVFRFHFWSFQLQERRLGVTYEEWKRHVLGIKEAP